MTQTLAPSVEILALVDYLAGREPDHEGDIAVIFPPKHRDIIVAALRQTLPAVGKDVRVTALPPVQRVEMVEFTQGYEQPAAPMFRVMVSGICADFETETAANNMRSAILALAALPPSQEATKSATVMPKSLHWLGDREDADGSRHAVDMTGCVMYFEQQSDCLQFMRWLTALSHPVPTANAMAGREKIAREIPKHIFMNCSFEECTAAEQKAFRRCADAILALTPPVPTPTEPPPYEGGTSGYGLESS